MSSKHLVSCLMRHSSMRLRCSASVLSTVRYSSFVPVSYKLVSLAPEVPNLQSFRYKSKGKGKKAQREEESDSDDDEAEEEEAREDDAIPGSKLVTQRFSQLRIDKILKTAIGSRSAMEAAFYAGNIRRNGMKVMKKATEVTDGDIVDVVSGTDDTNPNMLKVLRLEILEIRNEFKTNIVRYRVQKNLLIKHYAD